MNTFWAIGLLGVGILILWRAAELLVRGAVALAERLGISPLIIGLTVVAMGTSAPEVAASIAASVRGMGNVALGNVYGSNVANLALVGGLASLVRPLRIGKKTLRRQIPAMLAVAVLLWPMLLDLTLGRGEGLVLLGVFATLVAWTVYTTQAERRSGAMEAEAEVSVPTTQALSTTKSVVLVAVGLAGLAIGADIAVRGAVFLGDKLGLSKAVIGLTIVAVGTSLPELATSLVASVRGQHDISIGNLVGSNIFNTLLVAGVTGLVRPFSIAPRLAGIDYWVMVGVSVAFTVLAVLGRRVITRTSGVILVTGYAVYVVLLLSWRAGS